MVRQSDGAQIYEVSCECGWCDVLVSGDEIEEHDCDLEDDSV